MLAIKVLSILVSSFLFATTGDKYEVLTEWELDRTSSNIEISYRYLMVADTFKTREIRIAFFVDAEPEDLIPMFNNAANFSSWSAGLEACEMINYDTSQWILYNRYDVPWPFKQQDVVTRYTIEQTDSVTTLHMIGTPEYYPRLEDVVRIDKYEGYWQFVHTGDNRTYVEFHTIAFSKPIAPRFIQDRVVQNTFIKSIKQLKHKLGGS